VGMAAAAHDNYDGLRLTGRVDIGGSETGGDALVFGYYDIRTAAQGGSGLSSNFFSIVNTSDTESYSPCDEQQGTCYENYYQAHVRMRSGKCSVEFLDFDIILSPNDVFTFELTQDAGTGATVFASCDTDTLTRSQFTVDNNGCYILSSASFPQMTDLIEDCGSCADGSEISQAEALAETRWGYVEVIGEIELEDVCVSGCATGADCTKARLDAGEYNSWTWMTDGCEIDDMDDAFFGKVYYVKFDSTGLAQLGAANAISGVGAVCGLDDSYPDGSYLGQCSGIILHMPDLASELLNPTGPGYAYNAAAAVSVVGAQDMNRCFFKNTIGEAKDPVINKIGAGATFGPTLADLRDFNYSPREVSLGTADSFNTGNLVSNINDFFGKEAAVVHYFSIPGLGQTRAVFTFPLQHFLGQVIEIGREVRYDISEAECKLPSKKFISPGLPTAGEEAAEVTILRLDRSEDPCADDQEGWVAFGMSVVKDAFSVAYCTASSTVNAEHCSDNSAPSGDDTFNPYDPGAIGLVIEYPDAGANANVFNASPMQWSGKDR